VASWSEVVRRPMELHNSDRFGSGSGAGEPGK
jgi:hypothetical protein